MNLNFIFLALDCLYPIYKQKEFQYVYNALTLLANCLQIESLIPLFVEVNGYQQVVYNFNRTVLHAPISLQSLLVRQFLRITLALALVAQGKYLTLLIGSATTFYTILKVLQEEHLVPFPSFTEEVHITTKALALSTLVQVLGTPQQILLVSRLQIPNTSTKEVSLQNIAHSTQCCALCGEAATLFCGNCKQFKYCGNVCQETHWNLWKHHIYCQELRKLEPTLFSKLIVNFF